MKVFIQKINGEFPNVNYFIAWQGFKELSYDISFFESDNLTALSLSTDTIVCAGINIFHKALTLIGVLLPCIPSLPVQLESFTQRRIWTMPLREVRRLIDVEGNTVFVKPLPQDYKLFNGHVVREFKDLIYTSFISDEREVIYSEIVNFISEYRFFVHHKNIVGCKHYKGDYRVLPDFTLVEVAIDQFLESPVAYAIDFGVTGDGKCLLVEVNDAYSLGCYCLGPNYLHKDVNR
jgi:hypothetical protein